MNLILLSADLRRVFLVFALAVSGAMVLPAYAHGGPQGDSHADKTGGMQGEMWGGGPGRGHRHGGGAWSGPHWEHMVDRMLQETQATQAQREQIKRLAQAAAVDLKAQRQARHELHEKMMQAFVQPVLDAKAIEALRTQQIAAYDKTSKRMTQALLDVARVFTPEQRKLLAEHMKRHHEMMERHRREHAEHEGADQGHARPEPDARSGPESAASTPR